LKIKEAKRIYSLQGAYPREDKTKQSEKKRKKKYNRGGQDGYKGKDDKVNIY